MKKNKDGFAFPAYGSGNRAGADGSKVKEKRFRYSCHYNVRHPSQCDGQSGYGVTKLDAIVESIVCTKFSEIFRVFQKQAASGYASQGHGSSAERSITCKE